MRQAKHENPNFVSKKNKEGAGALIYLQKFNIVPILYMYI